MKVINLEQLVKKTSISRSSIYRMMANGEFPKPFHVVPNRNGWYESEIDAWLVARIGRAPNVSQPVSRPPEGAAA